METHVQILTKLSVYICLILISFCAISGNNIVMAMLLSAYVVDIKSPTLKIINLSKWCLKQVPKMKNSNAIYVLNVGQKFITYLSN